MIALVKALLSNCTFDRGRLTATCVKPFDSSLTVRKMEIGSSGRIRTENQPPTPADSNVPDPELNAT
jgi:hypothetical protein